jgi:hypothetical protein
MSATTMTTKKGSSGRLFDFLFEGCGDGSCNWIWNGTGYESDPDNPGNCVGGDCHCDPPSGDVRTLRELLGLDGEHVTTNCVGPGQSNPSPELIKAVIKLLKTIRLLIRVCLGLSLILATTLIGTAIYLWVR